MEKQPWESLSLIDVWVGALHDTGMEILSKSSISYESSQPALPVWPF